MSSNALQVEIIRRKNDRPVASEVSEDLLTQPPGQATSPTFHFHDVSSLGMVPHLLGGGSCLKCGQPQGKCFFTVICSIPPQRALQSETPCLTYCPLALEDGLRPPALSLPSQASAATLLITILGRAPNLNCPRCDQEGIKWCCPISGVPLDQHAYSSSHGY